MSKSGIRVRTKKEKAEDLITIQDRLKKGYSWRRIGEYINNRRQYNLSHVNYYRQYNDFVSKLNLEAKTSRDEYVEMMMTEINEAKTEVWNSWLLSKGEQKIDTIKDIPEKEIETVTKKWEDAGDINYLNAYIKLLERESKLLGLDAPIKKEIEKEVKVTKTKKIDYSKLSDSALKEIINARRN